MNVMSTYDAIFIGSGHNALVSAAYLAKAGWRVLVLERNAQFGGWVRTEDATLPGFRHDLYSSVIPLWLTSRVHVELGSELERFGLHFINTDVPTAVAMKDGTVAELSTSMEKNIEEFERLASGDGAAWAQMLDTFGNVAPALGQLFDCELNTAKADELMRAIFVSPSGTGPSRFSSEFMMTSRELLEKKFRSPVTRALLGTWPMHTGRGPDAVHSGLYVPLICGTLQMVGAPIVEGGVGKLAQALKGLIEHYGGTLLSNQLVGQILVKGGEAVGVRTESGEQYFAKKAVVASTNPDQLYLKLLSDAPELSPLVREQATQHRYGLGFFQMHVALSEPPQWVNPKLARAGLIHLTSGLDAISQGVSEATRGFLPAAPTIGFDVPSLRDPSRAPEGQAVMRIQAAEIPIRIKGDAAGEIEAPDGNWGTEQKQRFADRVLKTVSQHIPNLQSAFKAMEIVSPTELARSNPNAGPGAISSAPQGIFESYLFKSNHSTAVKNLFNVGAATWPGPAVSGGSGAILARSLLSNSKV